MSVIGIDLGTSNTLACVFRDGKAVLIPNKEGGYLTKSAVSIMEDGTIITGRAAKERLLTHPDRTAASYKVFMGTEREICLGQQYFKPEELSAFVLRQVKQDAEEFLQEPVEEAVISVPAYLIHKDPVFLRNRLDLLLDHMECLLPVTRRFAEFAEEKPGKHMDYRAVRAEFVPC